MRNAGLEEAQAGIKIAGRNINNLRYTDYTTLMKNMNSMERQKHRTLKDELPGRQMPNILLKNSGEITPEKMKTQSQSKNNTQLWM